MLLLTLKMKVSGQDTARLVTVYFICQILLPFSILSTFSIALSFENCKTTFSHSFLVIAYVRGLEYYFCLLAFIFNKQSHSALFLVNTKYVLSEKMSPC